MGLHNCQETRVNHVGKETRVNHEALKKHVDYVVEKAAKTRVNHVTFSPLIVLLVHLEPLTELEDVRALLLQLGLQPLVSLFGRSLPFLGLSQGFHSVFQLLL